VTQHAIGRGAIGRPSPSKPPLRVVPAPASPGAITALFEDQLPRLIARRSDLFDAVRGAIVVMVHGVGGWRISFGDHTHPEALTRAVDLEGDCVAVFSIGGFSALLDGQGGGQTPVVLGDARLLSRLGQLMVEPSRGPLGARLSSTASIRR